MRVLELARWRREIEGFLPHKPPMEELLRALRAAVEAPETDSVRLVVIDDDWLKGKIGELCEERRPQKRGDLTAWLNAKGFKPGKPFLSEAPYLILVFSRGERVGSAWIAVGYLLLALEELGLGAVVCTPKNPGPAEELLNVPKDYKLQAILPVGYPAGFKPSNERNELEEVVSFNEF